MNFINPIDGKTFTAPLRKGTTDLRLKYKALSREILDDVSKRMKEIEELGKNYEEVENSLKAIDEQLVNAPADKQFELEQRREQLLEKKKGFDDQLVEMDNRAVVQNGINYAKILHLLIDRKQLKTEEQLLIDQVGDSEFWMHQDMEEAAEEVRSFRLRNSLGE